MDVVANQDSQAWSSYGFCCWKLWDLWGNDGPCKGDPAMGPCSSCNPGGMDGEDESLHQLLTFYQLLALKQLLTKEVQIFGTARRSPGNSMPRRNWGHTRKFPGKLPPRRNGLSVAPTNVADWGNTTRDGQLVKTKRGGSNHPGQRRCRSWVSPTTGAPPHQLLGEEEPSLVGADMGDCLPPHWCQHNPHQCCHVKIWSLPFCIPQDWIEWCTRYVQMPSWWEELTKIPDHTDHQEFGLKVCASFEVPKASNQAKKVDNYDTQLLTHSSIWKHHFLLPRDMRFSTQDICLAQLHHTIAYARALQHWAEKVHPQITAQPCFLVRSVQDLWQAMEPLVSFKEAEVFMTTVPSNWMESSLTLVDEDHATTIQFEPHPKQLGPPKGIPVCDPQWRPACCYSHVDHCKGRSTDNFTMELMPHQSMSESWPLCSLPGFAEITQTLGGKNPWRVAHCWSLLAFHPKRPINLYKVMGTPVTATSLLQHQTTGEVLVHIQFCSKGIVGLGLNPVVDNCPALTIQELSDSPHPTVWHSSAHWLCHPVFSSGIYAMFWCHILPTTLNFSSLVLVDYTICNVLVIVFYSRMLGINFSPFWKVVTYFIVVLRSQ